MALFRYLFGTLWCLFVWLCTAILVGVIVTLIFPPAGDHVHLGVGTDLRNLPGTILGFLAAVQSWRKHVRKPAPTPPATPLHESGDAPDVSRPATANDVPDSGGGRSGESDLY